MISALANKTTVISPTYDSNLKLAKNTNESQSKIIEKSIPNDFGEFLVGVSKSVSQTDKFLAAAYFVQNKSSDNTYSTVEANQLLAQQGVKLTNAAQCNSNNVAAKRAFSVSKGKFRISQPGVDHLKTYMSESK